MVDEESKDDIFKDFKDAISNSDAHSSINYFNSPESLADSLREMGYIPNEKNMPGISDDINNDFTIFSSIDPEGHISYGLKQKHEKPFKRWYELYQDHNRQNMIDSLIGSLKELIEEGKIARNAGLLGPYSSMKGISFEEGKEASKYDDPISFLRFKKKLNSGKYIIDTDENKIVEGIAELFDPKTNPLREHKIFNEITASMTPEEKEMLKKEIEFGKEFLITAKAGALGRGIPKEELGELSKLINKEEDNHTSDNYESLWRLNKKLRSGYYFKKKQ